SRDGAVPGVYSHDTALAYYELSDVNPSKLHMTVPRSFRRNAKTPRVLILYRMDLAKSDIAAGPGYSVTTPLRTLRDIIEGGQLGFELVEQAIRQAISRGLVSRSEMRALMDRIKKDGATAYALEIDSILKRVA